MKVKEKENYKASKFGLSVSGTYNQKQRRIKSKARRIQHKTIVEKQDVNEEYIFDILDRWAESRRVKTKKR